MVVTTVRTVLWPPSGAWTRWVVVPASWTTVRTHENCKEYKDDKNDEKNLCSVETCHLRDA